MILHKPTDCDSPSGRPFWSLWDMLKYEAQLLLGAMSYVAGTISEWRLWSQMVAGGVAPPLAPDFDQRVNFMASLARLRDSAISLNMPAASAAGREAVDFYMRQLSSFAAFSAYELNKMVGPAERLLHAYVAEAEARQFYAIESRHAAFYADAEALFGASVVDAFPSAAPDISEAGKCRALGRWTASVMHLMRALEVGLQCLAKSYGVDHVSNWNQTLNELEAKLRGVSKKIDGADAERWAAEAGTHLRFLKNAHRNHAMHPLERYDEERAVEIYDSTRSFMRHLSGQISE